MIKYTVFKDDVAVRMGICSEDTFELQAQEGEEVLEGHVEAEASEVQYSPQALRRMEYPPIGEQLDCLWHAMDEGIIPKVDGFYDAISEVKAKYPKPALDA